MRPVTRRHIALPVSLSVTAALLYTFRPQILAAFAPPPSVSTQSTAVPASTAATPLPPSRSIATAAPPHRGRGASEAQAVERRLASMGLRLRRRVQPDGNCQFRALADQFFNDEERHARVRADAVEWLRANPKFYAGFLDQAEYPTWQSYIGSMARNFAWGDHMTLQAAAEVYNADLVVVSSLPDLADKDAVTFVEPSKNGKARDGRGRAYLLHWHERHFDSLEKIAT